MADKTLRFGLVLSPEEKAVLEALAERERITAAAVIRRLIWSAGQQVLLTTGTQRTQEVFYEQR